MIAPFNHTPAEIRAAVAGVPGFKLLEFWVESEYVYRGEKQFEISLVLEKREISFYEVEPSPLAPRLPDLHFHFLRRK